VGAKEDAEADAVPITAPTWRLLLLLLLLLLPPLLLLSSLLLLPLLLLLPPLQGSCMLRSSGWLARASCSTKWRQVLTRIAAAVTDSVVVGGVQRAVLGTHRKARRVLPRRRPPPPSPPPPSPPPPPSLDAAHGSLMSSMAGGVFTVCSL
jgi:hypothetical protein